MLDIKAKTRDAGIYFLNLSASQRKVLIRKESDKLCALGITHIKLTRDSFDGPCSTVIIYYGDKDMLPCLVEFARAIRALGSSL